MEKIAAVLGIILSLLSLGSAYDSFTSIGLMPKLIVCAAAALLVLFSATRWFAKRLRPTDTYIGGGLPEPGPSPFRIVIFSILLAVIVTIFIALSFYLIERFTLRLNERTGADASATLLIAPDASVDSVTIELPPKGDASCDYKNRSQSDIPPLLLQMIGFDTPTPQLHIDNFVSPQRVEIDCKPAHSIRGRIILPARVTVYLQDNLRTIQLTIIAMGVLIWLLACFGIWLWSD